MEIDSQHNFGALTADYAICVEALSQNDSQFWRRTFVRTVFSIIEAFNDGLRDRALHTCGISDDGHIRLTTMSLLTAKTFRIEKNGKVRSDTQRHSFLGYTAFLFRTLAKHYNIEDDFFSDGGWDNFQKAIKVRDKITHPKLEADLDISDEELRFVTAAIKWHQEIFNQIAPSFEDS